MIEVIGRHAIAKMYADSMSNELEAQLQVLCDNRVSKDSNIIVMPTAYPGSHFPNGFSMTISDRILPTILGPDIGYGIQCDIIHNTKNIDFDRLDDIISKYISKRSTVIPNLRVTKVFQSQRLFGERYIDMTAAIRNIGMITSKRHYIEICKCNSTYYLIICSGSGELGKEVYDFYMTYLSEIFKNKNILIKEELLYADGLIFHNYIKDANILYNYAFANRNAIANILSRSMKWKLEMVVDKTYDFIVNQIDGNFLLRKGVQSAYDSSTVVIPTDTSGTIIGKVNRDVIEYNSSAPSNSGKKSSPDIRSVNGIHMTNMNSSILKNCYNAYNDPQFVKDNFPWIDSNKILVPIYCYRK